VVSIPQFYHAFMSDECGFWVQVWNKSMCYGMWLNTTWPMTNDD